MDQHHLAILNKIEQLFLRYGIKSVTMDDIARELSISKKTLYQYYPNKKTLVKNVLKLHFEQEQEALKILLKDTENAIDEMLSVFQYNCQFIKNFNPSIIYDLKKYYPGSWKIFENYKNEIVYSIISHNIRKGISEGFYRQDLNPEIIARLYVQRLEIIVDPEIFPNPEFDAMEVYREFLEYHLRGMATLKGAKYIEENQKNLI